MHPSAWAVAPSFARWDASEMKGRFALLLILVPTVVGCFTQAADPVVDGWPIGPELSCDGYPKCPEMLAVARDGLDRRDPDHAAVVRVTLHAEGTITDADGNHILMTRSGPCCNVARFELADATVNAIGVGSVGVDPVIRAFDVGP